VGLGVSAERGEQLGPNVLVLEIILWTDNQFAIDDLMDVPVIRQGLDFSFRPDFRGLRERDTHAVTLRGSCSSVKRDSAVTNVTDRHGVT
jgi:hypothetical protein